MRCSGDDDAQLRGSGSGGCSSEGKQPAARSSMGGPPSLVSRGAAAAALLLPLTCPGAASAANDALTALLAMHGTGLACDRAYWLCVGLGTTAVLTTLLFTSRFVMS